MRRLPYVVTFLVPLQSVLAAFGLRYAVYALLAGGTAVFLLRAAVRGRAAGGFRPVWIFVAYVGALVVLQPGIVAAYGFLTYAQFALFWLSYVYAYGEVDTALLTRVNLAVATVVAVVGLYQYLLDPTLSGFSTYGGVEVYLTAGRELRINSLLPSAMTLGAYMVVSVLLALTLPARTAFVKTAVALCLICAFLTGNKSTLFCLGAAGLYWLVERSERRHGLLRPMAALGAVVLLYLVILSAAGSWAPWLARVSPTVYRAVAPFFFTGDIGEVAYLLAYWAMLFTFYGGSGLAALAFGNGLGLTRQNTTFFGGEVLGDFIVAEGFLVQLLFEIGIVGLVLFHVVLWRVFRAARERRVPGRAGFDHVLAALYANMIVVHVFSGVFLGFLWGYFASLLSARPVESPAGHEPVAGLKDPVPASDAV